MTKTEYIEVSRKAHELSHTHGRTARTYAAKLASTARAEGKPEAFEFWKAVENTLTPRDGIVPESE